jgi:predicted DNA-binding protein
MAALSNARWERFCLELAAGKPASTAYKLAGYRPSDANASTLRGNQKVKERLAELQAEAAQTNSYSVEKIIAMIIEDRSFARENGQAAAAGAATERLAKVLGMWVDRKEVREVSDLDAIDNPDELRAKLIEMARGMGERAIADALVQGKRQH